MELVIIIAANLLMIFSLASASLATCHDETVPERKYLGRYFANYTINSTESMLTLTSTSLFQCRHLCNQTLFCRAISYHKTSGRNFTCTLYNINNLNQLLQYDGNKDTIFITPADYQFVLSAYIKAQSNVIEVASKDENPGSFTFVLETGLYRIKLIHVSGGFVCDQWTNLMLPFGCVLNGIVRPARLMLVKGFRGPTLLDKSEFTNFEGDGSTTRFLETSEFKPLIHGQMYSFWYVRDFSNYKEYLNRGTTSFEFHVQQER